jgi:hypothetical protein
VRRMQVAAPLGGERRCATALPERVPPGERLWVFPIVTRLGYAGTTCQ